LSFNDGERRKACLPGKHSYLIVRRGELLQRITKKEEGGNLLKKAVHVRRGPLKLIQRKVKKRGGIRI